MGGFRPTNSERAGRFGRLLVRMPKLPDVVAAKKLALSKKKEITKRPRLGGRSKRHSS